MAESYTALKNMSEPELIRRHDKQAGNTVSGLNRYATELRYRELIKALAGIQKALELEDIQGKLTEISWNTT